MVLLHTSHYAHSLLSSSQHSSSFFTSRLHTPRQRKIQLSRTLSAFRKIVPTMMPEGPEVRTLVDQLQPAVGKRLVNLQFLSGRYTTHGKPRGFDEFRKTMTNYLKDDDHDQVDVVTSWNCKGKFIWLTLDQGRWKGGGGREGGVGIDVDEEDYYRSIWITLGMTGRFVREEKVRDKIPNNGNEVTSSSSSSRDSKQPRWYLEFLDEDETKSQKDEKPTTKKIYYYDTRNFGTLRFSLSKRELEEKLDSLGPDILTDAFEEEVFLDIVRKQRQELNICKFLIDQSKISGVGNYLLSEALYRANLDPFSSLGEITDDQARKLYAEIIDTARASYNSQGMTIKDGGSYRDLDGNKGKYSFELQCYGRDYCPKGNLIFRETDGPHGRAIWYVKDQLLTSNSRRFGDMATHAFDVNLNQSKEDLGLTLTEALTDKSWRDALATFLNSETFDRLSRFVESERRLHTVYPLSQDVFSALNKCPLDNVKVVIIGQDPYHGPGQGHGLAFSVQRGIDPPPSLRNIFKELQADEGIRSPPHGNLENWARQGVLLLNTVFTVRRGEANSHSKMGWEDFSDEVVRVLNDRREGIVFLLWGSPAAKKGRAIDLCRHTVITTSHPSPLGASKTDSPFLGSRCFSRCNDVLVASRQSPIDWNII